MKKRYLFLLPFLIINLYPQQISYEFSPYTITIDNKNMEVNRNDEIIWQYTFRNPSENEADLDGDSLNEFIIIDEFINNGRMEYTLFIFNTIDTFFLVDSVKSGITEPYIMYSEEIEDYLLITGSYSFMEFIDNDMGYLPVNCYKYETGELMQINDEIYDIFISENDLLLEEIIKYFRSNIKNCNSTKNIRTAISAAYANYINAGEPTLASHLISNYYYCDDKEAFIKKINDLIQN
jgi:hypothetical protein